MTNAKHNTGVTIMAKRKQEENLDNMDTTDSAEEQTRAQEPARKYARTKSHSEDDDDVLTNKLMIGVFVAAILILFNGFQLISLASSLSGGSGGASAVLSVMRGSGTVTLGAKETVGTALTAVINQPPVLPGYGTRMIKMETISEIPVKSKTGDAVQDAINTLVPTGTPFYGTDAGVSFDDPINSMQQWGKLERSTKLTPEQEQRWNKIVGSFTCDYCCGSPQNPTIINRCGCAHAAAWRGIAKFMIGKYGDQYTDAQILGEMSRWKALWYPGPTIKRAFEEGVL
ncbi:hypothetical protein HY490_05055 [Candidatus Woesearchaeota archaeon]|nr:hypothetical protein [Candidatus Woesearchaeota archaeon]